eukprot:gene6964-9519_t
MHRVVTDYSRAADSSSNIKVYVRARPLEEETENTDFIQTDLEDERKIIIKDPESSNRRYGEVSFQFDRVFWTNTHQEEVFNTLCRSQVDHILNGYNSCCFAYGQTGSGKTYTMFGSDGEIRGLIPRSVEYLFQSLAKRTSSNEVAMVCSFLEIYNDQIRDLGKAYLVAMGVESSTSMALYEKTSDIFEHLAGKRGNPYFAPAFHKQGSAMANVENKPGLKEIQDEYNTMNYEIREDNEGNVFVKDLSLVPVTTMEEVMSLISMGLRVRATHETKMNAFSSRSHTVFTITVLQRDKMTGQAITGMLNLVDLAGSERLKKSESQGIRLKEALHINTSLTALGKVIMALDPSSEISHVPYRDSKLTRVLQNSLGGNSYTSVIAAIHPSPKYYEECLSTLQFANRCRNVRNNPRVNYVEDTEDKDRKIKKLIDEITQLRSKLSQQNSGLSGSAEHSVKFADGKSGGGEEKMSLPRLVSLLKRVGLQANLSSDGIVVNGKKYTMEDLGLGDSLLDTASGETKASKDNSGNMSVDKLQKIVKELKETQSNYAAKAKDRKSQMEEQGRELQKLSAELTKCHTIIKHKEFEISTLLDEKDRCLEEQRVMLETKHQQEITELLNANREVLQKKHEIIMNVPSALKTYTELVKKADKEKTNYEIPVRQEFEKHLQLIEKSRKEELAHIRLQYEHWLTEKDKVLSGFVDSFNKYRVKKVEQLRMAESEIVRLFNYTEKLEEILDDVESGKFQVEKRQMTTSGGTARTKPTTREGVRIDSNTQTEVIPTTNTGTVVLPKGLRPANPLKVASMRKDLGITLRIIEKHKERVSKLEKMKEETFQKTLYNAAHGRITTVDEEVEQQIRNLLRTPKSIRAPKTANATNSDNSHPPLIPPGRNSPSKNVMIAGGDMFSDPTQKSGRPMSANPSSRPSSRDGTLPRINGEYEALLSGFDDNAGQNNEKNILITELLEELQTLRQKNFMDQISTSKVAEELAGNETLSYISKLEEELAKMRNQLADVNKQLTASKVANASLSRRLSKDIKETQNSSQPLKIQINTMTT